MDKQKALDKITKEIKNCKICQLDKLGLPVPGEGNPNATVMFLGEAPGKQEAKTGRPFIGRSGQLLRKMIQQNGLIQEDVFITSPVKYLPKRGTPTKSDIAHGKIHLEKQIKVIDPRILVLLGNVAAQAVLDTRVSVLKDHGKVIEKDGRTYFLTIHPAAVLRFQKNKVIMEEDFKKLKKLVTKI